MHSSGSITRKFGPTWKQSTGQTSTQSMYLHLIHFSVTTKVIAAPIDAGTGCRRSHWFSGSPAGGAYCAKAASTPKARRANPAAAVGAAERAGRGQFCGGGFVAV